MPTYPVTDTRTAFASSVDGFLSTVARVGDDQWGLPAGPDWTVRQLVAHVVRGMGVIAEYLDAGTPVPDERLADAAAYFRAALATDDAHVGIAARAVAAAADLGPDPVARAREVARSALDRAAATPDDRVLVHIAGALAFIDYLGTRVLELVLHTTDLQAACGLTVQAPSDALAVVNPVLLALADRADPLGLALARSGRPGRAPCDVLG